VGEVLLTVTRAAIVVLDMDMTFILGLAFVFLFKLIRIELNSTDE